MITRQDKAISTEIQRLCEFSNCSTRLIRIRWIAGALVILTTLVLARLLALPLYELPLYLTGAGILVYNAGISWELRRAAEIQESALKGFIQRLMTLQLALDWIGLAALLYLTGGVVSPLVPLIPVQVLVYALLVPGVWSYGAALLPVAALALTAVLPYAGLLPPQTFSPAFPASLQRDPVYILSLLAGTSLAAVAAVYLISYLQETLQNQEIRTHQLIRASQLAASTARLSDLLNKLMQATVNALQARGALLRLLDDNGDDLSIAAAFGLSQAYQDYSPKKLSQSPLDRDVMEGNAVIVTDVENDVRIRFSRHAALDGIHSLAAVPIIGKGHPLGVLSVYSPKTGGFSRADADFLNSLASQCAAAIENTRICEQLEHADETRTQFVRMLTHELRAPVGGAQTLLRTLLRGLAGELNEQQRDILGRLERRLDSLMALINDLLSLSASRTVDLEAPQEQILLKPFVQAIVDRFSSEAENKQIHLSYFAVPDVLSVQATEEGLDRIFSNLISNAIKYTPEGGEVEVTVGEQVGKAVVTVSDSGIGIPLHELSELWVDFFRASNARRSGIPGTGLGLSIVKQLVNHFGGTVEVRSTEGKGSIFKVMLPLARMPLVNPVREPVSEKELPG